MGQAGVSLGGLGLIAAGSILAWSGVNDPPGGPVAAVRDLLQGKLPTPGVQVTTQPVSGAVRDALNAWLTRRPGRHPGKGSRLPALPAGSWQWRRTTWVSRTCGQGRVSGGSIVPAWSWSRTGTGLG
jgi:hypothetical protein